MLFESNPGIALPCPEVLWRVEEWHASQAEEVAGRDGIRHSAGAVISTPNRLSIPARGIQPADFLPSAPVRDDRPSALLAQFSRELVRMHHPPQESHPPGSHGLNPAPLRFASLYSSRRAFTGHDCLLALRFLNACMRALDDRGLDPLPGFRSALAARNILFRPVALLLPEAGGTNVATAAARHGLARRARRMSDNPQVACVAQHDAAGQPTRGFSYPECTWCRTAASGSPANALFSLIDSGSGPARARRLPEHGARTSVRSPTCCPSGRPAGVTCASRIQTIRSRNARPPSWGCLNIDVYPELVASATAVEAALPGHQG